VAFSLACIVLGNNSLKKELQNDEGFEYSDVLYLLHSKDKVRPSQSLCVLTWARWL
jgi:hypothetical protein